MAKVGMLPLSQKARIQANRRRKFGIRTAKAVKLDYSAELWYRNQMITYINKMRDQIEAQLITILETQETLDAGEGFAMTDSLLDELTRTLGNLERQWTLTKEQSAVVASQFTGKMDDSTKSRLQDSIRDAVGIDFIQLTQTEGLTDALKSSIFENTRLIKSIPEQYLGKIEEIINQNSIKGGATESMIDAIRGTYNTSVSRARLIARDQSNKLNGTLTRERQTSIGVRAYRWRTVGDGNVRETHKERNGKVYAWKLEDVGKRLADGTRLLNPGFTPNDIGHPGDDIQCRCIAEPVLELDRMGLVA